MSKPDLEKVRRELHRWLILQCLDVARPLGAGETLLQSALADTVTITQLEMRRELDYLVDRELVVVSGRSGQYWHAKLTRHGVDVVEYTVDVEPGIARPQKYW